MRDLFDRLADEAGRLSETGEVYLLNFAGETSDFIRFNRSAVRQPGSVRQASVSIDLIEGYHHAEGSIEVSADWEETQARLAGLFRELRELRKSAPEDPHILYNETPASADHVQEGKLPTPEEAISSVLEAGKDRDLVGLYAGGHIYRGFANSFAQRNWSVSTTFNFDWSFCLNADKAVKTAYAGFDWSAEELAKKAASAADLLKPLAREPRTVPPGHYRVYLAPAALAEITDMMSWGGFGLTGRKTRTSPLMKLVDGKAELSALVTMSENTKEGAAPPFQSAGFIREPTVPLIDQGKAADPLISPRSAAEYGAKTNGASGAETPQSLDMAPGDLPQADVLGALGTGLFISNLWYLNFSDRAAGRLTGMTRFASFWVENGELVAPLSVMRFDETIYNMLGTKLTALTKERDLMLDPSTYGARTTASSRLPGAIIDDFTFTL